MDYSTADLMAMRMRKRLGLLDDGLPEQQAAIDGARAGVNGLLDMRHVYDAPMAEMTASRPTYRDRVATWIADKMGVDPTSVAGGRLIKGLAGSTGVEREGGGLLDVVPGFAGIDAAQKISEASDDPSLAKMTGAGVRSGTAIASMAPVYGPALKAGLGIATTIGGAGLAEAARRDMGSPVTAANAAGDAEDPQAAALREEIARLDRAATGDLPGRKSSEAAAIRAGYQQQAAAARARLADMMAEKARAAQDKERGTFDAATAQATKLRDAELARMGDRFSNTNVAKIYKETGGFMPLLAGGVAGAMSRAAPAKSLWDSPKVAGALAGVTATNAPLAYDAFMTPVENPEKRAYEVYGRELPDGHPDKAKAIETAAGMPTANPIRTEAQREFYDPIKLAERIGVGTFEGVGGGLIGSHAVDVPKAIGKTVASAYGKMSLAAAEARNAANATKNAGLLADQQALDNIALQKVKNKGLLDVATGDAEGALRTAAEAQKTAAEAQKTAAQAAQLKAGASPAAAASADLMAGQEAQTGLVPVPARPRPAPVSNGNPALPAPSKQPRGWANSWSAPAREAVIEFKTTSPDASLSSLSGVQLRNSIIEKLPPGVKPPAQATVNQYFKALKEDLGPDVPLAKLKKTLKGNYQFTGPAIAAGGLGLLSMDDR